MQSYVTFTYLIYITLHYVKLRTFRKVKLLYLSLNYVTFRYAKLH